MAVFSWDSKFAERHPGLTPEWAKEVLTQEQHRKQCKNVEYINQDLAKTHKALIIMGCSFADGQGALPQEFMSELTPIYNTEDNTYDYSTDQHTDTEIAELAIKFKLPVFWERYHKKKLTAYTYGTELHNCWGSQLGRKFNDEYTVINLADRGAGNNSSIQKLYRYTIDWNLCDEVMVVWSVCDYTRWSMLHSKNLDRQNLTGDNRTFWWIPEAPRSGPTLNSLMSDEMYSAMFFLDQYLDNCTQLQMFCNQFKSSNIVMVPAFSPLPENDPGMEWHYYLSQIAQKSGKDLARKVKAKLLTQCAWDVAGHGNVAQMCMDKLELNYSDWFHYVSTHKGKPNAWISACSHPSHLAQTWLSDQLYQHITEDVL